MVKIQIVITAMILILVSGCSDGSDIKKEQEKDLEGKEQETSTVAGNKEELSYSFVIKDSLFADDSLIALSHFRGLDVKGNVACFSGSNGRYFGFDLEKDSIIDYGHRKEVYDAEYRDVEMVKNHLLLMNIVNPSAIRRWKMPVLNEAYINNDTLCFLDGMDFWDDQNGLAFGDPLNGAHFILFTNDGGKSWERVEEDKIPVPLSIEAGFAASGTSIQCIGDGVAYIGLGGEEARILKTEDFGKSWSAFETPMLHGTAGKGIYSLCFKDELNGVAVGGNWENKNCDSSKIYTNDGGLTWNLSEGIQEYRSCVTHLQGDIFIATGSSGTDISYDNGVSWESISSEGYNAIQFNDNNQGLAISNSISNALNTCS